MELNLILLFSFCTVIWFISTDESVAEFVVLVGEYIKTKTRIYWWWVTNNPRNPIVKFFITRNSYKEAEKLRKWIYEERDRNSSSIEQSETSEESSN
jgi:hypothetical protein